MKRNIVKMSLVTVMLLTTGAYSAQIIGANPGTYDSIEFENKQFGFGGWYLGNVEVSITDLDYNPIAKTFSELDGTYTAMDINDSFESAVSTGGEVRGLVHGKDWPVGEPAGIKIINGDTNTKNGKPENCIMTTSYLTADKNNDVDGLLNSGDPAPVICSSPFQSHKRFKVNMLPSTVVADGATGEPIDLVFNLDTEDANETKRYQVFQKINNYTDKRLDGYTVEVLDSEGNPHANVTLSLGLGENIKGEGDEQTINDIWDEQEMANYSHGLWGPETFEEPVPHFPSDGFFDKIRAYFPVSLNDANNTASTTNGAVQGGNYDALFGHWLPSSMQPYGLFWDDDNNPLTDAQLVAFWGTAPDATEGTAPEWHEGMAATWNVLTTEEVSAYLADPDGLYTIGHIEDTLNLGLNYIVVVGENNESQIGDTFTIRITPSVSLDQTPPSYIDENGSYILPPEIGGDDNDTDDNGTIVVGGGGGGGCTYNPNSNNFDMTFLMLMALGSLYAFRRRFLK